MTLDLNQVDYYKNSVLYGPDPASFFIFAELLAYNEELTDQELVTLTNFVRHCYLKYDTTDITVATGNVLYYYKENKSKKDFDLYDMPKNLLYQ